MFMQPPKFISYNSRGKVLWGGETLEAVLTNDPDGPAKYIQQRSDISFVEYKTFEINEEGKLIEVGIV